jgi:inner membrane protein
MTMERPVLKIATIAGVGLLLMIGVALVDGLVDERRSRQHDATEEVAESWGKAQTFSGPQLRFTWLTEELDSKKKPVTISKEYWLMPDSMMIRGDVRPHKRRRGIYDVVLYETDLEYTATFSWASLYDRFSKSGGRLQPDVGVVLSITDPRSFSAELQASVNGKSMAFKPTDAGGFSARQELRAELPEMLKADSQIVVRGKIRLRGSQQLSFIPTGKNTRVVVDGAWADAGFSGTWLPEHPPADSTFHAEWNISYYGRNFSQVPSVEFMRGVEPNSFSISLHDVVNSYVKTERSVKYIIVVIVLTFALFFVLELLAAAQIHPVQYLLVGCSLVLFYLLLLGISEFLAFDAAYGIATGMTVLCVALYMRALLGSTKKSAIVGGLMFAMYGFMLVLLSLQEYSLLLGSFASFVALASIMFTTRKVQWSRKTKKSSIFRQFRGIVGPQPQPSDEDVE